MLGAIEVTTGAWVDRVGHARAADFIALLSMLDQAFPQTVVIVVICDNDSSCHARKVTAYLKEHPGWNGSRLRNYVANTAVSWPGHLRKNHSFFRVCLRDQMLASAAPWTSPWLPPVTSRKFGMPLGSIPHIHTWWT
jgi:hypothetical protein